MAKKDDTPDNSTSSVSVNSIISGMVKDVDDTYTPEGAWSHARNATKVTANGSLNTLSNEPSNKNCFTTTKTIIGYVHLYEDKWLIFSTDDTTSEIGLFDDSECSYDSLVNDPCIIPECSNLVGNTTSVLNFKKRYLIKGAAKQNFDCTWSAYFADGNNPDRYVTVDVDAKKIVDGQFVRCESTVPGNPACIISAPTCKIDCEMIRLAPLMSSPCVTVSNSKSGGSLLNGSYFAVVAYTINSQVVTSYFPPSNVQPIFVHSNLGGSIDISFSDLDTIHFSEFELVIVRTANLQTVAKRMGIYSTRTQQMTIDNINEALTSVPIEQIPIVNPIPEKSEAIYSVGDYLLRLAPTNRFDFNYQPLANQIQIKWLSIEYPSDYYRKGGNNPSYMSDEIYPFFIRWIYNTGDRSSSYHIPGRAPRLYTFPGSSPPLTPANEDLSSPATGDKLASDENIYEVFNTASKDVAPTFPGAYDLPDGGRVIAQGDMAYWESSELYPDNKPEVWGDLCGKPIRHHKMPDRTLYPELNHINPGATKIRLLGIKALNIAYPLDNNLQPIPGIVGYEILRGSREGNKTVIAKGILNNMRAYDIPNEPQGLYQNFTYNYWGDEKSLTKSESKGGWSFLGQPDTLDSSYTQKDKFTFHSPDTQFKHPFLAVNELKTYGQLNASVKGSFTDVPDHPKEKLVTDLAFIISALVGIAEAALAIRGQERTVKGQPNAPNYRQDELLLMPYPFVVGGLGSTGASIPPVPNIAAYYTPTLPVSLAAYGLYKTNLATYNSSAGSPVNLALYAALSTSPSDAVFSAAYNTATLAPGLGVQNSTIENDKPLLSYLDSATKAVAGLPVLSNYWAQGTDTTLRLIYAIVPYEQYAYCSRSHGLYNNIVVGGSVTGRRRYLLGETAYLSSSRQQFNNQVVNNVYRNEAVILKTQNPVENLVSPETTSPRVIGDLPGNDPWDNPTQLFTYSTTSYYTALIQRIKSQYGQLDSIQQIVISCPYTVSSETGVIFGGDTYVSRYTEKNTFFYFYDWLQNQPDGYEFDYRTRYMLTYPRYWADFSKYEAGDFMANAFSGLLGALPNDKAALDRKSGSGGFFGALFQDGIRFRIKEAYFYLFQSGIRDFYVESEVNTDLRDWGDVPEERYYDPYAYTDLSELFAPKIIKSGNYFKYDYSLSISKLYLNFISWGAIQGRDYNPTIAQTCYVEAPKRLLYSLPQNLENKKDFWRVFLANNYKDFYSKVATVKSFNQNGALILFTNDSPILWKGVDTLQTDIGTKLTIGDGGLFAQPDQSIVNVDISYEYGSCQDRLSVLNTPFGLYYMSSAQGKIFHLTQQLDDITYSGLKFWFKEYLPFKLLEDFPNFDILDNPVAGIGCQAIYDNQIETIYFCKKDYKLREGYTGSYDSASGKFNLTLSGASEGIPITVGIGDSTFFNYFYDASWTVSYDPKSEKGGWISFHDWHPTLNIPSRMNFLTVLDNGIWRHNQRRDDFCNYYDQYYPFELEYIASTKLSVNTLRSIEYYMECYKYAPGRLDKFHMLNWNFDQAIVHNTEQVSGLLRLNLAATNDPWGNLAFPNVTAQPSINILYNKVEQKYRFNQFWDITDNRGEFTQDTRMIWITEPNGYIRSLNAGNLNYVKAQTQRKKFRHYTNKAILTKLPPATGDTNPINMTVKVIADKNLLSMR